MNSAPPRPDTVAAQAGLGWVTWIPVAIFAVLGADLFLSAGFLIRASEWRGHLVLAGVIAAAAAFGVPRAPRLCTFVTALIQGSIITSSGMLMTYAAATSGSPLADRYLLWADRFIGYDWASYARFVASSDGIAHMLWSGYMTIFVQPVIIIGVLAFSGRIRRLEIFILGWIISLLVTIAIFDVFPATTTWTYLGISHETVAAMKYIPDPEHSWIGDLLKIRAGGGRILPDFQGAGLIAFPSYHCIAALMFVWAIWPVAILRPAFIGINAIMIAATPIIGGHYMVDLLAGALVTIVSVVAARYAHRAWLSHRWRAMSGRAEIPRPLTLAVSGLP